MGEELLFQMRLLRAAGLYRYLECTLNDLESAVEPTLRPPSLEEVTW